MENSRIGPLLPLLLLQELIFFIDALLLFCRLTLNQGVTGLPCLYFTLHLAQLFSSLFCLPLSSLSLVLELEHEGIIAVRPGINLAADVGLACTTPRAMPANNLLLRFVKAERGPLQKMLSWAGVEELVLVGNLGSERHFDYRQRCYSKLQAALAAPRRV